MGSVLHGTLEALRTQGESQSHKTVKSLSYRRSGWFASGSLNYDVSCMLLGRDAVLDGPGQAGIILYQSETSDTYLPDYIDFFVCNSRLGRLH